MNIYVTPIPLKTCRCCGVSKEISLFHKNRTKKDGLQGECKDCNNARSKTWNKANPEKKKAQSKARYQEKKEQINAQSKARYQANPEKKKAYNKARYHANPEKWKAWSEANKEKINADKRNRRKTDPEYRITGNLRSRLNKAVNRIAKGAATKSASTKELLGCSEEFLRSYLESQFEPWMTWDNYGPDWHVDHIRPCASFDLTDPKQQEECFHYTNLRPLEASRNMSEGARGWV
jgi:hypothetical protein